MRPHLVSSYYRSDVRICKINWYIFAACPNNTIWGNKHIETEVKSSIYKRAIRPLLTYTTETKTETWKTEQIIETKEMEVWRKIAGKTPMDRVRSEDIRAVCRVDNINGWVLQRKKEWNVHIFRLITDSIVKIMRDRLPSQKLLKIWSDNL